jgi:hypothetical protein
MPAEEEAKKGEVVSLSMETATEVQGGEQATLSEQSEGNVSSGDDEAAVDMQDGAIGSPRHETSLLDGTCGRLLRSRSLAPEEPGSEEEEVGLTIPIHKAKKSLDLLHQGIITGGAQIQ